MYYFAHEGEEPKIALTGSSLPRANDLDLLLSHCCACRSCGMHG